MCVFWLFSQLCATRSNLSDYGMGVQMNALTFKETRIKHEKKGGYFVQGGLAIPVIDLGLRTKTYTEPP